MARMGLGELKISTGRAEEAAREFERALRQKPSLAAAHLGLGNAYAFMGRNEEALDCYNRTLALKSQLPEAEFAAGFVLARMGRLKEAEARYRRALTRRPDFAAAWMNLGSLLREQGREAIAEAALLRAVELRPDLIAGWVNLAQLERERRRPAEAEAHLRKAFALNPAQVETHIAWCQFRAAERDLAGAWQWLRWALARQPDHAEAVNMHGILLHNDGRFAEAVEKFVHAEQLGNRASASNRGNSLLDMGRMDEALRAHEAAVEQDPEHAGAMYNLALTRLRLGDWQRGWQQYEARWRFREVHRSPRIFEQPRWQGEPLEGRRVLLHAEQGLGDTIQFCRYATLVAACGGVPILQVQSAVERLMRSLAVARCGQAEIALLGEKPPAFDLECPLLSLPAVFTTTIETVPWPGAYLGADPELAAEKYAEFPSVTSATGAVKNAPRPVILSEGRRGDRSRRTCGSIWAKGWDTTNFPLNEFEGARPLRVGVVWAGNPRYKADAQRSMHLRTLLPLLHLRNITWVSLQKGAATDQLADLPEDISFWDGARHDKDLADTAALASTLDLIITTDTCIAHLAGAMGKPVWILLPHLSDWRWMQEVETTPWYPTARLFRQHTPGNWAGVVARVIWELSALFKARSTPAQRDTYSISAASRMIPARS